MEHRGLMDLFNPPSRWAAEWLARLVPAEPGPGHDAALGPTYRRSARIYDHYLDPETGAAAVRETFPWKRPWPLSDKTTVRWAATIPVRLPAEPGEELAEIVFDFDGDPAQHRYLLWARGTSGRLFPAPQSDPRRGGGINGWGPGGEHGILQSAQAIYALWRDFGAAVDAHGPYPDALERWLAEDLRGGHVLDAAALDGRCATVRA